MTQERYREGQVYSVNTLNSFVAYSTRPKHQTDVGSNPTSILYMLSLSWVIYLTYFQFFFYLQNTHNTIHVASRLNVWALNAQHRHLGL